MSYYLYTETAFHHEGDLNYLKELILLSSQVGAQGVKFQILTDLDYLISSKHSAYGALKKMVFSEAQWIEVFTYCNQLGLDIIFMPINPTALKLTQHENYQVKYIDLHSVSFYDEEILAQIKTTNLPLIIGIGGRTKEEIKQKHTFFGNQLKVLMVGFQAFPSKLEDIKIEKIRQLKKLFPTLELGYADHSSYDSEDAIKSNELAYVLGARFFEKHITLNEGLEREDYESAIGKEQFVKLTQTLNYLAQAIFSHSINDLLTLGEAEVKYRNRERVAVAKVPISKGEVLDNSHFTFKMIDKPNGIAKRDMILGKELNISIEQDEIITMEILK